MSVKMLIVTLLAAFILQLAAQVYFINRRNVVLKTQLAVLQSNLDKAIRDYEDYVKSSEQLVQRDRTLEKEHDPIRKALVGRRPNPVSGAIEQATTWIRQRHSPEKTDGEEVIN